MSDSGYSILISAISKKLAKPLVLDKEISDRRGTVVLKLVDSATSEYFALKFSQMPSYAADVIANEAKNLQDLLEYTGDLYCDSGVIGNFSYVLTRWLDGDRFIGWARAIPSLPTQPKRKRAWLNLSLKLIKTVHELHNLGYLHYDIQPEHFRLINDKAQLIDFGQSYAVHETNPLYKGGLVHFQSPETCRSLVEKQYTIEYNKISEIYAVASTLFYLYTEHTVIDYDFKLPLEEKWRIISNASARSFAEVGAEAFLEFENVLQLCLEPNPQKRIDNLEEVIALLEKL